MNWQKIKDILAIILIWLIALSIAYIVYLKANILIQKF